MSLAAAIVFPPDNACKSQALAAIDTSAARRAAATRDYLVGRGVSAARFTTDGRGSREPVADNSSATGRAANRRVEIYVAEPATTAQR